MEAPPPPISVPTTVVSGKTNEFQGSTTVSLNAGLTSVTESLSMKPPNGGFPNMQLQVGAIAKDSSGVSWYAVPTVGNSPSSSAVPIGVTISSVPPQTLPTIPITITVTLTYTTTGGN